MVRTHRCVLVRSSRARPGNPRNDQRLPPTGDRQYCLSLTSGLWNHGLSVAEAAVEVLPDNEARIPENSAALNHRSYGPPWRCGDCDTCLFEAAPTRSAECADRTCPTHECSPKVPPHSPVYERGEVAHLVIAF